MAAIESNMAARKVGMATSPYPSVFAPLVFAGKLEEGMQALSQAGFTAVEISLRSARDLDFHWLAEKLDEYQLSLSAFASGRMCLEDNFCLCDPHPEQRSKAQERLTAIIRLAAQFHAPVIIGGVRGKLTGSPDEKEKQRQSAVEILKICATVASETGTHLVLEPINRYETNFMNAGMDALELKEEIGSPAVKVLLDTFHMNIEEADPCQTIKRIGSALGYLHVADNNRLAPGQGHIDFPAIFTALAEIGYSGPISAEILPLPDNETAVKLTGEYLDPLVKQAFHPRKQERKK